MDLYLLFFFIRIRRPPSSPTFPSPTSFRSRGDDRVCNLVDVLPGEPIQQHACPAYVAARIIRAPPRGAAAPKMRLLFRWQLIPPRPSSPKAIAPKMPVSWRAPASSIGTPRASPRALRRPL